MKHFTFCLFIFFCSCSSNSTPPTSSDTDTFDVQIPEISLSLLKKPKVNPLKDTLFFPRIGSASISTSRIPVQNLIDSIEIKQYYSTTEGISKIGFSGRVSYFFEKEYELTYRNQSKIIRKSDFKDDAEDKFFKNANIEKITKAYVQKGKILINFECCNLSEYPDSCIFITQSVFKKLGN